MTSLASADEPAAAPEAVEAPAGVAFYPTASYRRDPAFRPRPMDATREDDCDRNDPRERERERRCREVDVERSSSMNSPALVVVGGALTVVGALGIAGGVSLLNHEASASGSTDVNCRAGTSGVDCDPQVDTSGAEDALFTVAGVGTLLLSGAVAITGVTLVVIGAVPEDDGPPPPTASFSLAPTRATFDLTF